MPLNLGEQFRRIDPALHRPIASGKHLLQGLPLGAFQPQHIRRDKAAAPRNGVDDALALQLLIGLGDGVGVDADLAGQRRTEGSCSFWSSTPSSDSRRICSCSCS